MLLAKRFGAEIVSVDSMQVYRGMDIGTAKPTSAERAAVPHHLVDVAEPEEVYSVARFQRAGREALSGADAPMLIVGGSGLHFRSLVDPLTFPPSDDTVRTRLEVLTPDEMARRLVAADADAPSHIDLANPRRVVRALEILEITGETPSARAATSEAAAVREYRAEHPFVGLAIDPGAGLTDRVQERFDAMMSAGLVAEVEGLADRLGPTAAQAVGYREMVRVVRGEWGLGEAVRRAVDATTSLARRQRTYLRRDPRLHWLEWDDDPSAVADRAARRLEEAGWSS